MATGKMNATLDRREQALRLLTIFAIDEKELRSDLITLIETDPSPDQVLRKIALESYTPAAEEEEDRAAEDENRAALELVLKRLESPDAKDRDSDPLRDEYVRFLSRFPSTHACLVGEWLKVNASRAHALVVEGLAGMTSMSLRSPVRWSVSL